MMASNNFDSRKHVTISSKIFVHFYIGPHWKKWSSTS